LRHGWWCRDEESSVSQPGEFQGHKCWLTASEAIDEFDLLGIARLQGDVSGSGTSSGHLLAQPCSYSPPVAIFVQTNCRDHVQTYNNLCRLCCKRGNHPHHRKLHYLEGGGEIKHSCVHPSYADFWIWRWASELPCT